MVLAALPVVDAVVAGRQRRIAVPGVELVLAEPLGLHLVVAVAEPRIGLAHRRLQRIDDFALDRVVEVAAVGDVLEAVPAVGDFLVLGQHIGDVGEQPLVVVRASCRAPLNAASRFVSSLIREQVAASPSRLSSSPSTSNLRLAMVSSNSRFQAERAGHRLFVEQLLDLVVELVGLGLAQLGEPRPVARQAPRRAASAASSTASSIRLSSSPKKISPVERSVSAWLRSPRNLTLSGSCVFRTYCRNA